MQRNHIIQSTHLPVSDCDIIVNTSHEPRSMIQAHEVVIKLKVTLTMHILHLHLLKLHLHSVVSLHVVSV